MTSRTNRISNITPVIRRGGTSDDRAKFQISNSQSGVTLLLGILVLSAILAISLSLATIMFVEVRSSSDLLRSETSYYAAQTIGEQALYKIKRNVDANPSNGEQCGSSLWHCYFNSVGGVDTNSIRPAESTVSDPVQQVIIPQSTALPPSGFPSNAQHYVFYNPANPNGDSGYGKISITYLPTGADTNAVQIYLCEFDPTYTVGTNGTNSYSTVPCSEPTSSDGYWKSGYGGPTGGYPFFLARSPLTLTFVPGKQQELVIFNPPPSTAPVYLQIQTFDSGGTPLGIPYLEQTAVDINAQNGSLGRKLRVLVPNATGGNAASQTSSTGSVVIVKNTTSGDGSFTFSATGNSSLTSQVSTAVLTTSGGIGTRMFSNIVPGTYSLAENVPAGWNLSSSSCSNGTPGSFTVAAGSSVTCTFNDAKVTTTHFSVSAPASVTAGSAFNITVTALDASNNVVTGYTGTVHFTSTNGTASLPANSTLTNGTRTFSVAINSVGNYTISATDTVMGSIAGTSGNISASNPPLNLDFEIGSAGSCPTYWSCTGDATTQSTSDSGANCALPDNIQGAYYLKAGCDSTVGTARSQNFVLPAGAATAWALRAGGADGGSGWFIKRVSDNAVLCAAQNGTDTDSFFSDPCSGLSGYGGTLVYIYVVDDQVGGWAKTYLDNIIIVDGSGNQLLP